MAGIDRKFYEREKRKHYRNERLEARKRKFDEMETGMYIKN